MKYLRKIALSGVNGPKIQLTSMNLLREDCCEQSFNCPSI